LKTTAQMYAALCCIFLTDAKLTETQTPGTNFSKLILCNRVPNATFAVTSL